MLPIPRIPLPVFERVTLVKEISDTPFLNSSNRLTVVEVMVKAIDMRYHCPAESVEPVPSTVDVFESQIFTTPALVMPTEMITLV